MPDRHIPIHTLKDMGYTFNAKGELRSIQGDEPYKFTTQEHYEELGDAVTHEVYNLMEAVGMQRILLKKPTDNKPDEYYSFIFASPDYDQKSTLLILMHGMGAVRAGQWARRLIINESLDRGSMLPYIERAMNNNWGVIVTNSNLQEHFFGDCTVSQRLQYSKTHDMHMENVWYRFVRYTRAVEIYVVAHSRGGHDVATILENFPEENRVQCICLTDSWFEFASNREQQPIVINWAARSKASMKKPPSSINYHNIHKVHQIWAGTLDHPRTNYMAINSIFHVLEHHPDEANLGRLLQDAWDIMDPPPLDAEGAAGPSKPRLISKDEEGNIRVNEEALGMPGSSRQMEEEEEEGEPNSKLQRVQE